MSSVRRSAGTAQPHVFLTELVSPQPAPLPNCSVKGTVVILSSKLGIVESPVHFQSRFFLQPQSSTGLACGVEGRLGLEKQGPDVESRGQAAGGVRVEKGAGSTSYLLAHFPRGLGPIPERWGAGGRGEDPHGGAEGPISLPERKLRNHHRCRWLHRHSYAGW